MNISQLLKEKKLNSRLIKENYNFLKKNKALGIILISDINVLEQLLVGCRALPVNFVVYTKNNFDIDANNIVFSESDEINSGFDFIVTDNNVVGIDNYLKKGIVPIIPEKNYMRSILKEFNPMKNEGNSFFYDNSDAWSIFYSIVRYLENYKFSFDNKNLVKNVFNT
ncbi:hypothetical protein CSB08_01450 [Candidatus Gracilibacteria bacterium]|nr:MAG: hypothetical protein CSB08_01450 [Candidatus Gracilibacteria bacterium]PIE85244.1 MAG: hypothetical protein CSA08_03245 [Candidatus Gracilibacteria bacterium]